MSEGLDKYSAGNTALVPLSRYLVFFAVATLGLASDLISKEIVFAWPGELGEIAYWWWPGHAGIQTSFNEGALFGIGYGMVWLFVGISIIAALAIPLWLFVGGAGHDWWLTLALGGVLSGVLGNLYDRLGMHGETWPAMYPQDPRAGEAVYAVRDWILWQASDTMRWPNFNLADAFLVVGAAVLFFRALFEPQEKTPEEADAIG